MEFNSDIKKFTIYVQTSPFNTLDLGNPTKGPSNAPNSVNEVVLAPINKFNLSEETPAEDVFIPTSSSYAFVQNDKSLGLFPPNDFHLPIFLTKIYDYYKYVDVKKDDTPFYIERQNINPFFIEVDFFSAIFRNGLRQGNQLTIDMIEYIKSRNMSGETGAPLSSYPNTISGNQAIRDWFENIGYFMLPWDKGGSFETTLDDIEKVSYLLNTIRGKARLLNIDIQK